MDALETRLAFAIGGGASPPPPPAPTPTAIRKVTVTNETIISNDNLLVVLNSTICHAAGSKALPGLLTSSGMSSPSDTRTMASPSAGLGGLKGSVVGASGFGGLEFREAWDL